MKAAGPGRRRSRVLYEPEVEMIKMVVRIRRLVTIVTSISRTVRSVKMTRAAEQASQEGYNCKLDIIPNHYFTLGSNLIDPAFL